MINVDGMTNSAQSVRTKEGELNAGFGWIVEDTRIKQLGISGECSDDAEKGG